MGNSGGQLFLEYRCNQINNFTYIINHTVIKFKMIDWILKSFKIKTKKLTKQDLDINKNNILNSNFKKYIYN